MAKKKLEKVGVLEKREMIEKNNPRLPVSRQCELLGFSRSAYYYTPRPLPRLNKELMNRIDEIYLQHPDFGSRQFRDQLRAEGYKVNRKRIQRLMRLMCIQALYPKRNLSKRISGAEHRIYPYLLRNVSITRANQVWCADVTYIRLHHGFVYLVAIMDWYSRKILSWELSTTMDSHFCVSALERARRLYGDPEIFNSDQGCQFTSKEFQAVFEDSEIKVSMDGKGRALDNIAIERFWRTLKWGNVYLHDYENPLEAAEGIGAYIEQYNTFRTHSAIGRKTPDEVYYKLREVLDPQEEGTENQRKIS